VVGGAEMSAGGLEYTEMSAEGLPEPTIYDHDRAVIPCIDAIYSDTHPPRRLWKPSGRARVSLSYKYSWSIPQDTGRQKRVSGRRKENDHRRPYQQELILTGSENANQLDGLRLFGISGYSTPYPQDTGREHAVSGRRTRISRYHPPRVVAQGGISGYSWADLKARGREESVAALANLRIGRENVRL